MDVDGLDGVGFKLLDKDIVRGVHFSTLVSKCVSVVVVDLVCWGGETRVDVDLGGVAFNPSDKDRVRVASDSDEVV